MNSDEIRERLGLLSADPALDFKFPGMGEMADAAVLIALSEGKEGLEVVLTRRPTTMRKHAGQISFPGGRRDPADRDLVHTALRETHEELAIHPNDVEIFGSLLRVPTITGFHVTAYVGEFPNPYTLVPNPAEVDALIVAPLTRLADERIYTVHDQEWEGQIFKMHSFNYDGQNVWGATGFMLYEFLKYLGLK